MPKMHDTRKQRAKALVKTLECGPVYSAISLRSGLIEIKEAVGLAEAGYQLWVQTWVLPEIRKLIPELQVKNIPAPVEPLEDGG